MKQGFAPADESLLFRQKEPKPYLPVRGPSEPAQKQALRDASASVPNKMAQELAALKQPSPRGRFGTEAPPRPTQRTQEDATTEKKVGSSPK
jgi:hypothetical protein